MAAPSDFSLCEGKRADDKKALDLARRLVEEARGLATTLIPIGPMLNDKVTEIFRALNIAPPGLRSSCSSCKQDQGVTQDSMLKELDVMIDQSSEVIESGEPDHYDTDVVFKASGGRALCGVYYSNYKPVKAAGMPILSPKPENVSIFHPDQAVEESYKHFIRHGAAAEFVNSVARNGTHIGVEVKGLINPSNGRIGGGGVFHLTRNTEETRTAESLTTSVSVMHCKSIAMKEFQIKDGTMELPQWVKKEALFIREKGDNDDGQAAARDFMKLYGSHVPAGKHKLGGIFYTIADARSDQNIEISKLCTIVKRELESHISSGFLDMGVNANIKHTHKSDMSELITMKEASINYTFSKNVIGPLASNPKQFENLLSYNSTWAIIDRGPVESYIPVWRLIRRCGAKYELAADILKKAWKGDEEKRKKQQEQQEIMQKVEQELIKTKDRHLECRHCKWGKSYRPKEDRQNAKLSREFKLDWMEHEQAYNKAIEFIMEDPEHIFCKIVYKRRCCILPFGGYSLTIWKAPEEIEFEEIPGSHVLFFSEMRFKWKDKVHLQGKETRPEDKKKCDKIVGLNYAN